VDRIDGSNFLKSVNTGNDVVSSIVEEAFFKRPKFISLNPSLLSRVDTCDSNDVNLVPTPVSLPLTKNEVVDLTDSPPYKLSDNVDAVAQKQLTKTQKRRLARRRKRMRKKLRKLRENINESEVSDNVQKEDVEVIDLVNDSEEEIIPELKNSCEVAFSDNIGTELEVGAQDDENKYEDSQNPDFNNSLLDIEMDKQVIVSDCFAIDQNGGGHSDTQHCIENDGKRDIESIKMKLIEKKAQLERARLQLSMAQMSKSEALNNARAQLAAAWKRKE
jgi:hypothetical protein